MRLSKSIFLHSQKGNTTLNLSQNKTYPRFMVTYPQLYPLLINRFMQPSTQVGTQGEIGIYQYLAIEIIFGY
jgi:hypothetical protein